MSLSTDKLLAIYLRAKRPPKLKYKPPRKAHNVALYG